MVIDYNDNKLIQSDMLISVCVCVCVSMWFLNQHSSLFRLLIVIVHCSLLASNNTACSSFIHYSSPMFGPLNRNILTMIIIITTIIIIIIIIGQCSKFVWIYKKKQTWTICSWDWKQVNIWIGDRKKEGRWFKKDNVNVLWTEMIKMMMMTTKKE